MTPCAPVFIVGMNGSGTSMMLDSMGRHPELYAVPDETLMMPHIIKQAPRFGDLMDNANFTAYGRYAIDQMPVLKRFTGTETIDLPENWLQRPRTIESVFDGIFGPLAEAQGKRRWCEKTPDHVQHIRKLAKIFPLAKFVHMIRDGREVASSISRRQLRRPELVIFRWKCLVREGQSAGASLGDRYLEIRYEDLTNDPRKQMERLCHFLDIEFSGQVLESRMPQNPQRKVLPRGTLGVITANPAKWPIYFDVPTVRRLEAIGGQMLQTLGYDVRTVAGDSKPSWWQQKRWRAADFVRYHIALKKRSKKYNTWPKILGKMVFSFKEYLSKKY